MEISLRRPLKLQNKQALLLTVKRVETAVVGIIIAFIVSEALQKTSLRNHFIYTTDGKGGAQIC